MGRSFRFRCIPKAHIFFVCIVAVGQLMMVAAGVKNIPGPGTVQLSVCKSLDDSDVVFRDDISFCGAPDMVVNIGA